MVVTHPQVFVFFTSFKIGANPAIEPFLFNSIYHILAICEDHYGNVVFFFNASNAVITASSSMRLLVVSR